MNNERYIKSLVTVPAKNICPQHCVEDKACDIYVLFPEKKHYLYELILDIADVEDADFAINTREERENIYFWSTEDNVIDAQKDFFQRNKAFHNLVQREICLAKEGNTFKYGFDFEDFSKTDTNALPDLCEQWISSFGYQIKSKTFTEMKAEVEGLEYIFRKQFECFLRFNWFLDFYFDNDEYLTFIFNRFSK